MDANALRNGTSLKTIGGVVYQDRGDGYLTPIGKVRQQPAQAPAQPNALNPIDEALRYYLGPTGIPDKLAQVNALMNPIDAMAGSMEASQRMLSPETSGWGRVQAAGDMLSGVAGVVAPAVAGAKVGMPAAQAIEESLMGFSNSPNALALRQFGADESGALRDPRFWHPASDIKLRMPADEMRFTVQDKGDLIPARPIDIAELQGRTLVPAFGDRTRAGGMLTQINDSELTNPVDLQGGADFMRSQGGIWASEPDAMKTKAKHIGKIANEVGEDPVLAYTAMGAQSGDFSRMMSDAVMGQLRPSMANMIDPAAVQRYDDVIRKTVDKDWPGVISSNVGRYIEGMTGSNRRLLWQEMDKGVYRDAGFPDVGATRLAITDPRLVSAQPFDTGLTFGRVDVNQPLTETTPDIHATYRSQIHGNYLGGLPENVPGEMIWRDFFNERRSAGAAPATDQRAFMMKPSIKQTVDLQMVEEVSRYLESLAQRGGQ